MPNGWVHAAHDLIAFGMPYLSVHQAKDNAARTLGPRHRMVDHEWYWQFGTSWTFSDPFPTCARSRIEELAKRAGPDEAEVQEAIFSHDYLDRIWDDLPPFQRKYWEGFMVWLILHPAILKSWAGVDVKQGTIHRIVDGQDIWEACAELKPLYRRLRRYVEFVKWKDPALREMVARCGECTTDLLGKVGKRSTT